MATVTFTTPDGPVEMVITSKCMLCGHETESYLTAREHIDNNEGHYYVSICK